MQARRTVWLLAALGVAALVVNLGVGLTLGLARPMESDAYYFFRIAESVADGSGYRLTDGFWPDEPTLSRMPGWTGVVAALFKIAPGVDRTALMRVACLAINAFNAVLVALLAWRLLGRRPWPVGLAGGLYILHPTAVVSAYAGLSEPLFVGLCLTGVLLLLRGGEGPPRRALPAWCGFLALGLATLVRPNFAPWIGFFLGGVALLWVTRRARFAPRELAALALGGVLFVLPLTLWALRNYSVCDRFPVISTLRGQTFYGGNNEVVARLGRNWGYWIFPNSVPGETPMVELARTMSEYEVDVYYHDKGKAFIAANPGRMPLLLAGKLIRAYVPVPWAWSAGGAVLAVYRLALYVTAVLGLVGAWRGLSGVFRLAFGGILLSNVLTVLVFYGYNRFAFPMEPLLLPFAAQWVWRVAGAWVRGAED